MREGGRAVLPDQCYLLIAVENHVIDLGVFAV